MDYLVYRIAMSPSVDSPPPAGPAACGQPNAPSICSMLPQVLSPNVTALFGYPSAPELLGRVTAPAYVETPPNSLQSLYFVVAEDNLGDLSSPSNAVGGPSFASCGQPYCPE